MDINFVNSDKKLCRSKIYINKDKYKPTNLDIKFLKTFNIPIKIGSFSLNNNTSISVEWYNSPNDISYFYKPLFDFIELKNGYIKLDEESLSVVCNLSTSVLNLLLFNNMYYKFMIEDGRIIKEQNYLMSCISGYDFNSKTYDLLFYVTNHNKKTTFNKLDILYTLNANNEINI